MAGKLNPTPRKLRMAVAAHSTLSLPSGRLSRSMRTAQVMVVVLPSPSVMQLVPLQRVGVLAGINGQARHLHEQAQQPTDQVGLLRQSAGRLDLVDIEDVRVQFGDLLDQALQR